VPRRRKPRRPIDRVRAVVRAVLFFPMWFMQAFMLAFAAAFGGIPKIRDPPPKNPVVQRDEKRRS